ncbi:MAG: hypothetical protein ABJH75_24825, partial [Roseibium sp.]|uniref:hypothetical protein n=1 Tax=Roseibium sp. TaxID=1936156 RepID=UPI003297A97F
FIKKIQAYEGGNGHSLWVLNKLRNIDKHRLLLASLKIAGVTASWRTRDGGIYTNCGIGVDAGESGTFLDMPMDYIEFTDQPRPLFEVTLTESPYVYDAPVAALLDSFACNVQSVLNSAKIGI